jgi:hypothetical protein
MRRTVTERVLRSKEEWRYGLFGKRRKDIKKTLPQIVQMNLGAEFLYGFKVMQKFFRSDHSSCG